RARARCCQPAMPQCARHRFVGKQRRGTWDRRAARPRPGRSNAGIVRRLASNNGRSEEHTSELQSQSNLVCRLLLEKKKTSQPTSLAVVIALIVVKFSRTRALPVPHKSI